MANALTNTDFTVAEPALDGGVAEWLLPKAPAIINGVMQVSGGRGAYGYVEPWAEAGIGLVGTYEYPGANIAMPAAGESWTGQVYAALGVAGIDGTITLELRLGRKDAEYTTPVLLNSQTFDIIGGEPVAPLSVAADIPADYVAENYNGLALRIAADTFIGAEDDRGTTAGDNDTRLQLAQPFMGLTADVPAPDDGGSGGGGGGTLEPATGYTGDIGRRVAAYLGKPASVKTGNLAAQHAAIILEYVRGYTRGKGFADVDGTSKAAAGLEAVIVAATARLTANPEQVANYTAGDYSERPAVMSGWLLHELAVLNNYRRRYA